MSLFQGNERAEVNRWIVDLEAMLAEMNEDVATQSISENRNALSWLRRLLASEAA